MNKISLVKIDVFLPNLSMAGPDKSAPNADPSEPIAINVLYPALDISKLTTWPFESKRPRTETLPVQYPDNSPLKINTKTNFATKKLFHGVWPKTASASASLPYFAISVVKTSFFFISLYF